MPGLMQALSDHGLNPFAAKLLAESYLSHEKRPKVTFVILGVRITLEDDSEKFDGPGSTGEPQPFGGD